MIKILFQSLWKRAQHVLQWLLVWAWGNLAECSPLPEYSYSLPVLHTVCLYTINSLVPATHSLCSTETCMLLATCFPALFSSVGLILPIQSNRKMNLLRAQLSLISSHKFHTAFFKGTNMIIHEMLTFTSNLFWNSLILVGFRRIIGSDRHEHYIWNSTKSKDRLNR